PWPAARCSGTANSDDRTRPGSCAPRPPGAGPGSRRARCGGGRQSRPWRCSGGLAEELAADQHAADLAGAGADLVELGVSPQAAGGVVVDVAVAAQDLDALARHPGGFFGAVQNDAGAVLAHLAHVLSAQVVQVLADRVAEGAAGLQGGVQVGQLALDQLE